MKWYWWAAIAVGALLFLRPSMPKASAPASPAATAPKGTLIDPAGITVLNPDGSTSFGGTPPASDAQVILTNSDGSMVVQYPDGMRQVLGADGKALSDRYKPDPGDPNIS